MFIRRVSWMDLNKLYQCKICNHENDVPLQACRHLLAAHPEIVGALREFLLRNKTMKDNEERSLYSIALEEPLPIPPQHLTEPTHDHSSQRPPNPSELTEKALEARIQHFTEMLMPGYLTTPPTIPHLPGMPSFQQSFNRPPIFDGTQNGMVPLPPHSSPPMTSAAAIFGVPGMGLPERPMVTPVVNQEGIPTTSPSPTTTHSSLVGMAASGHEGGLGLQAGHPEGGSHHGHNHHGGNQSDNIQKVDFLVEGNGMHTQSQPQSPLQGTQQPLSHSPRPSSQSPRLPSQLHHHLHGHYLDQLPNPSSQHALQPPIDLQTSQTPSKPSPTISEPSQPSEKGDGETRPASLTAGNGKEEIGDDVDEKEVKEEKKEAEDNPFEMEELLTLLERWVKIPLSCPFCCMKLPYMKRKDKHRCKRPGPSVLCDICGKSYPQTYFRFHYRRVHVPQKKVPCHFCNKEFKPSSLSKHILERHKPSKPYRCGICGKEFNSKKHCDKHEAVHKTEKPHKCPTCNRGFTQRTNMKNHMRQHTGEQPYRCHNCMKSFTHNVSLKNHLKRYHGIDLWMLGHTGGGRPKKE